MTHDMTAAALGAEYRYSKSLEYALERIAIQLDKWAAESKAGGWSTHQVKPMQSLASEIRQSILLRKPESIR